jgi:hypothetical protein
MQPTNRYQAKWWIVALAVTLSPCHLVTLSSAQAQRPEYNRDVRPILVENCFLCHGPDSASRKARLRLDQRDWAIKKGAIVPGHPEQSELIARICAKDASERMPPRKTQKILTAAQKETLRRWIAAGAEYQPHWSFLAPKRPPVPAVKNKGWVRNPLDAFILARLEKEGLIPSPEADRRTLARRLSLDLIGLPPEPAEVEAFVKDKAPNAYERFVDRLLASPHWGEHRGRYWLDAARYADSNGIHFDNYREIWSYRDWVIAAFNKNMPFDQFTIEQLAGDLLPHPMMDQLIATGFNRCNITSNEGGLIPEEYLVLYTRDRTVTTAKVWLGMTANCAVCHDHKYDPFTQKDFYSLSAFFNNTTQAAMDGNVKDTPPVIAVPRTEDRPHWNALEQELAQARKQMEARKQTARAEFERWLTGLTPAALAVQVPRDGLRLLAPLSEGAGNTVHLNVLGKERAVTLPTGIVWEAGHVAARALKVQPGGTIEAPDAGDFDKNQGFSYAAWVRLPGSVAFGAIAARMDDKHDFRGWDLWVENNRVGTHIIHMWPDDAIKVVSQTPLKPGQWNHVLVSYDGSAKAAGVRIYVNGVLQTARTTFADKLKNTIRTTVPLKIGQRHSTARLNGLAVQDVRLYDRALSAAEAQQLARGTRTAWLAQKPTATRSPQEKEELFAWWLSESDMGYRALTKRVADLRQEEAVLKARGTVAHIMQERPGEPIAYVLFRGDYDKRRDKVKAATPKALPLMPADLPHNRLGLARWLVRPENPLMARVTVNRFWEQVFGTGLVRTPGDFGVAGELPSHPELLDWLAVEFRESGWDVKHLFKLMVTSATYRQSSAVTKEQRERDPANRLLSRGPRYRLDGELLRDYALAASGLLVPKIGGPSVKPYQPPGVWEAVGMIGSNTREYKQDHGEALYRRSLYTFWKRAAPPASMDILGAPTRETCTVQRERTDTPLQALVTLNDPQFVEAARHLAQVVLLASRGHKSPEFGLDCMARRLLSRPLRPAEAKVVRASLNDLLAHYKANPADARKLLAVGESPADPSLEAPTLAAWTMLANEMMNLDEVLNK